MFNPFNSLRRFQSRIGKPIRPIVEVQKGGSVVNVITTTVQEGNLINNSYTQEAYELHPGDPTVAVFVDGVFKGVGYFAGEEGAILSVKKDVELYEEVRDHEGKLMLTPGEVDEQGNVIGGGKPIYRRVVNLVFKGLIGKALDAQLLERASALKASFMDKLIFLLVGGLLGYLAAISYAH